MNRKKMEELYIIDEIYDLNIRKSIASNFDFSGLMYICIIIGSISMFSNEFYRLLEEHTTKLIVPFFLIAIIEFITSIINSKKNNIINDILLVMSTFATSILGVLIIAGYVFKVINIVGVDMSILSTITKLIINIVLIAISAISYFIAKSIIYNFIKIKGDKHDS